MNVLTIDVEEYFQVSAFDGVIAAADWDRHESRVEATTMRLLDRLGRYVGSKRLDSTIVNPRASYKQR